MNYNSSYVLGMIALIMVSISCVFFVFYRAGGGRDSRSKTVRYSGHLGKLLFAASVILLSVSVLNGFAKGEGFRENLASKSWVYKTWPKNGKGSLPGATEFADENACAIRFRGPQKHHNYMPDCLLPCASPSPAGGCSAKIGSSCGPYRSGNESFGYLCEKNPPTPTNAPGEGFRENLRRISDEESSNLHAFGVPLSAADENT